MNVSRVLVAYATAAGSTAGIAERIADVLSERRLRSALSARWA